MEYLHDLNPQEPLAVRPRQAAALLGISERTLWSWTKDGIIPAVRVGRLVLYPVEQLRAWLHERSAADHVASEGVQP